ncbi:unnamed protein product [Fraxinus pennsylvanica]|uniref:Uncharacterized protein n=1 Tax=Fraxinus pennsylvanica TaxID=56036 RepID=A0AAD2A139_9LAMI|nr:unnamed protein product [Fraxinus pennsylvanica]
MIQPTKQKMSILVDSSWHFLIAIVCDITSNDHKTVRVWKGSESGNYDCRHILKDHTVQLSLLNSTSDHHFTFPLIMLGSSVCAIAILVCLSITCFRSVNSGQEFTALIRYFVLPMKSARLSSALAFPPVHLFTSSTFFLYLFYCMSISTATSACSNDPFPIENGSE